MTPLANEAVEAGSKDDGSKSPAEKMEVVEEKTERTEPVVEEVRS